MDSNDVFPADRFNSLPDELQKAILLQYTTPFQQRVLGASSRSLRAIMPKPKSAVPIIAHHLAQFMVRAMGDSLVELKGDDQQSPLFIQPTEHSFEPFVGALENDEPITLKMACINPQEVFQVAQEVLPFFSELADNIAEAFCTQASTNGPHRYHVSLPVASSSDILLVICDSNGLGVCAFLHIHQGKTHIFGT